MRGLASIAFLAALAGAVPSAAGESAGPTWERCNWLVRRGGGIVVEPAVGLRLLGAQGALPGPGNGVRLEAVHCERDSVIPDEWDDRVPRLLGVPLVIRGPGGLSRVEIRNTGFRVRFSESVRVTPAMRQEAKRLVNRWQNRPNPVR